MIDSLYAIVDVDVADRPLELAFQSLNAGCAMLQLRAKDLDDRGFLEIARRLRSACAHAEVPFIINDRPDIARLVRADGLHLGQTDASIGDARKVVGNMPIGMSTRRGRHFRSVPESMISAATKTPSTIESALS